MRTWVLGFSLVVATACGKSHRDETHPDGAAPGVGGSTADRPFTSGTRLRARVFDGGDGAVALYEWHDTELDMPCAFRLAVDGVVRCLPYKREARAHFTSTDIVYLDGRCSSPVALFNADVALPEYVLGDPNLVPCAPEAARHLVYRVGEELSDLPGNVYYRVGEECHSIGSPDLSAESRKAAKLGDAVDPRIFVAAERVLAESTERLSPVEVRGADGSRERVGVWDSVKAAECAPLWGDGAPCVPTYVAWYVSEFTDSACTKPQAYVSRSTPFNGPDGDENCPPPEVAVHYAPSGDTCSDWTYTLYEVGPAATGSYRLDHGACTPANDPEHSEFELGEPLPQGTFDSIETALVGNGRLKLEVNATHGGARLDFGDSLLYFEDTLLGETCSPVVACNGKLLCDPEPGRAGYYSDSACTEPVILVPPSECDAGGKRFFSNHGDHVACWDGTLLEVGDVLDVDEIYTSYSEGECTPQAAPTDLQIRRLVVSSLSPARIVDRIE
jgi:hypothetical protein